jgi:5-methylcytosine-specific restriction endonuclease McrA
MQLRINRIIPESKNGKRVFDNLVVVCARCNDIKNGLMKTKEYRDLGNHTAKTLLRKIQPQVLKKREEEGAAFKAMKADCRED